MEFRYVIHSLWLKKKDTQEIYHYMQETYKDACPSSPTIYYWVHQFNRGRKTVIDLPRSGRPKLFEKIDEVKKLIDEFPFASCRYIARIAKIDKNTVKRILTEDLNMRKLCCHWVPHDLTEIQKANRVKQSKELLSILQSLTKRQTMKVITADESWFFLQYGSDGFWSCGQKRPENVNHAINDEKVMFFTAFCIKGIVYVNVLPQNETFTGEYFANKILPHLKTAADNIKGSILTYKVRLHMDNAKPHNSIVAQQKMNELHIERLPHPPYSPDISPNDFFLYGYLKNKLKGNRFSSQKELIDAVVEIIQNIDESTWIQVYNEWIERIKKVIDCNGEYPDF